MRGFRFRQFALRFKPVFDSLKSCPPDCQRLAKTPKGLGTTFPVLRRWLYGFSLNVGGSATPAAMNALCASPSTWLRNTKRLP